jgi:26S proteasome regulatory subunit N8
LLGEVRKERGETLVDVTNSYAVPFEEDDQQPSIWFLDHNFHENMGAMFKKVNARENPVGWYSTGPRIRPCDLEVNELFRKYTPNPVLVIIDVQPKEEFEIPTKAYVAVEEVKENSTEAPTLSFEHIPSVIGALEAEEVGVEHLLRDVKDTSISTLATQVHGKLLSLKSLISHLQEVHKYLDNVCNGILPLNHQILSQLQDIFNLAPNLNIEELAKSFAVKTNDMMLVIYLSSLIRSIIALHSLINNKLDNRERERKADLPPEAAKKEEKKQEPEKKTEDGPAKKKSEPQETKH